MEEVVLLRGSLCNSSSILDNLRMGRLMELLSLIIKHFKGNSLHLRAWTSTATQCLLIKHPMERLLLRDIIMDLQLLACRVTYHFHTPMPTFLTTPGASMI